MCRPLRRGRGALQLGVDPRHGLVLSGLTAAEVRLVEALDGSRTTPELTRWALAEGISATRLSDLLQSLRDHAVLVEDPGTRADMGAGPAVRAADASALALTGGGPDDGYQRLARRDAVTVAVDGGGNLTVTIAEVLRRAGVGTVLSSRYAGWPGSRPDLAVVTASGALDPSRGEPWRAHVVPVLPVVLQGTGALVGPLVVPGSGPCLRCLDLTRTDLDPAWPAVLAQLVPSAVGVPDDADGETSLVTAVAGVAAMLALSVVDGHPVPEGVSLEVALPWPLPVQRVWPRHPACSCADPAARPWPGDAGAATRGIRGRVAGAPPASATMAV
jgi:hypothetical protein